MPISLIVEGINDPEGSGGQAAPIPVATVRWGIERTATIPAPGGTRLPEVTAPVPGDVVVTKPVDRMTPWLFAAATGSTEFREIALVFSPVDQQAGLRTRVTLGSAILTGYALESAGGTPVETLTIAYRTVDVAVSLVEADGTSGEPVSASFPAATPL